MYESYCENCDTSFTDINNFFCIKNRDYCEDCFTKVKYLNKKIREKKRIAIKVSCCKCGVTLEGRKMNNRKATCAQCQKQNMRRHNVLNAQIAKQKRREKKPKKKILRNIDPFTYWKQLRRADETVDKSPKKKS